MKMIRRFFTYVISVIAVLMLTYGYVYWGNLFGAETPAGQLISWVLGEEPSKPAPSVSMPPEAIEPMTEPVTEPAIESAIESSPVPVLETEPKPEQETVIAPVEAPAVAEPVVASPTVVVEPLAASLSELWQRARDSFHYRDYQGAIESYQEIIARTQNNFDAYEELGDVYAYYGKDAEAAAAYYEAAAMLVRLGKRERAAEFMKPLSLLDAGRARALLDQLEQAK